MPGRILHLIKEIIGDRGELGLSTKHSWMIGLGGVGAAKPLPGARPERGPEAGQGPCRAAAEAVFPDDGVG